MDIDVAQFPSSLVATASLALVRPSAAQSELRGQVVVDSIRTPVSGARLQIVPAGTVVFADSAGRFHFRNLVRGEQLLVTSAPGFRFDSSYVAIDSNEVVDITIKLRPRVTMLAGRQVTAAADPVPVGKMTGFHERRERGIGRFVDRAELERLQNYRLAGVLSRVPGVDVRRGNGAKAWAVSSRAIGPGKCAFCRDDPAAVLDRADVAAGAKVACYMDVYIDGTLVYDSASRGASLFDLNRMELGEIEGIEVYTSAAQIPAQYSKTSGGCGVILLWTRA